MRRREAIGITAGVALGTLTAFGTRAATGRSTLVYFGTQTSGAGQGIHAAQFDAATGRLTAIGSATEVARPTWLLAHPMRPMLYAVSETTGEGGVQAQVVSLAVDRTTGALRQVGAVGSGGGGATHLAFDPRSRTLAVANFGTGDVATLPVSRDGVLGAVAAVRHQVGSGPHRRQASAHAHGVAFAPGGYLLSADLGADRIFIYRFDPTTRALTSHDAVVAAPGNGPRHLAVAADGRHVYATLELTAGIGVYRWDRATGRAALVQTVAAVSPEFAGAKSTAEVAVSSDGRFLYASARGEDVIVVYAVDRRSGTLGEVQRLPSGGKTPWHFAFDASGRWLLVANQGSDRVAVFRVDPATGRIAATDEGLTIPKPVNVTFFAS